MTLSCAVISFPGNNCEIETIRAAERNGFQTQLIRWNQPEKIKNFDFYILPGGFTYEDRIRSGVIATYSEIFEALKKEVSKGKIILGICNGAQMIIESGLIQIAGNNLPLALTHNIRHNYENKQIMGTGFYNDWIFVTPERRDTAFTYTIEKPLYLPISHGEGRFISKEEKVCKQLSNGGLVAFRYCNQDGKIGNSYPSTPNGSMFATAGVVNTDGTVMAFMPHPERYYQEFDGDSIFQSIHTWINDKQSPKKIQLLDYQKTFIPKIQKFIPQKNTIYLEKKLIITDNIAFSCQQAVFNIINSSIKMQRTTLFSISSNDIDIKKIKQSGILYNINKESISEYIKNENKSATIENNDHKYYSFAVQQKEDDQAMVLSENLSTYCQTPYQIKIFTCWHFLDEKYNTDHKFHNNILDINNLSFNIQKILKSSLLSNPNSSEIFILTDSSL